MPSRPRSPFAVSMRALTVTGVLAGVLTVGVGAGPAHATSATTAVSGTTLQVTGSAQPDYIYVLVKSTSQVAVSLTGGTITPGSGCSYEYNFSTTSVLCNTAGVTSIVVRAQGSNDYVQVAEDWTEPPPIDTTIWLGPGDDRVASGAGDDTIYGEDGNDTQLNGGPGADKIYGGPGNDSGFVGDGSGLGWDASQFYPDLIDGGSGVDIADEGRVGNYDVAHFWSLDGKANDGADLDSKIRNGAEEDDNLVNIEQVNGSSHPESFVGNNQRNVFFGESGDDVFDAKGGDDKIVGGFGRVLVDAGAGNDEVIASGVIDLGPGRDSLSAGGDNDIIVSNDGEQDQIDCGFGADILYGDQFDVVAYDLTACELLVGDVSKPKLTDSTIVLKMVVGGPGPTTVSFVEKGGVKTSVTQNVRASAGSTVTFQLPVPPGDRARLKAEGKVTGVASIANKVAGLGQAIASRRITASF